MRLAYMYGGGAVLQYHYCTVTGETKVRETDIELIIFGSRDHTWLDEHEQGEWAGLEAPFAILHKVTIQTILDERNRDAQPRRP